MPISELAINNSVYNSTGLSPDFVVYRQSLRISVTENISDLLEGV